MTRIPIVCAPCAGLLLAAACGGGAQAPAAEGGGKVPVAGALAEADAPFAGLRIVKVRTAAFATVPRAPVWDRVPVLTVPLQAQAIAMPRLQQATITSVDVQAVHDSSLVAFRLRWRDASEDITYEQDTFPDACAVQFPLDADAPYTMGAANARVQILHWKALWQRDVDKGFQDVQDLHPNYWMDLYWFSTGPWPHPVPGAFADPRARAWFPALQAGNPMSIWNREQPVQELLAEGFGTLTAQRECASRARGVWSDGYWSVVFLRPLATSDPADHQFGRSPAQIDFAVWDGANDNVGGRKHHATWTPYRLEGP